VTGLGHLNALPAGEAERELLGCCGSPEWARRVASARPLRSVEALLAVAAEAWWTVGAAAWRAAFRTHPRIGERTAEAAQTERERAWSAGEQAGMATADGEIRAAIAAGNRAYEERFGHVFLVRAAGRSPAEILAGLRARLANPPQHEILVAALEQQRITELRLGRWLDEHGGGG
jgi:OHCU decarboxylase